MQKITEKAIRIPSIQDGNFTHELRTSIIIGLYCVYSLLLQRDIIIIIQQGQGGNFSHHQCRLLPFSLLHLLLLYSNAIRKIHIYMGLESLILTIFLYQIFSTWILVFFSWQFCFLCQSAHFRFSLAFLTVSMYLVSKAKQMVTYSLLYCYSVS